MKRESLDSTSSMVLIGLSLLSWTATATGFFKLAAGDAPLSLSTVFVGLVAGGLSAAIQVLMVLFFFRAAQPAQISPTRWLFAFGCAACMTASITLGISSYMDALNINRATLTAKFEEDAATVASQQGAAVSFLEGKAGRLSQVNSELAQIAAAEGQGSCGVICGTYQGAASGVRQEIEAINTAISNLSANWVDVQEAPEDVRPDLLRQHQGLLANEILSTNGNALYAQVQELLARPEILRKDKSNATQARAQTFVSQLQAIVAVTATPVPEILPLGTPLATGAVADVEKAIAVVRRIVTGQFNELDDKEKMAVILAAMVDVFIVLVMIWQVQTTSRLEVVHVGITETFQGSVAMSERLAQDAGFGGIVEGINAIEAAGRGLLGMPGALGQIVRVPVPRSNTKLNDLMINLKNAGLARTLPITFKGVEGHGTDQARDQRLFWVPAAAWRELQAVKTLLITSPKLSNDMTFGEFVDWVCSQPRNAGVTGKAKTIRSTIARNFPFAWPVNLNALSQARIEDILEGFDRTATVSDKTKRAYRRVFKEILAVANHKGLLPTDRTAIDLRLVA